MIRGSVIPYDKDSKHDVEVNLNIHNRFDIEVIDARTGEVKQKAEAYNVVCNNYWNKIFSVSNWFTHIHYGSGTGTPSETDTSMFEYRGSGAVSGSITGVNREEGFIYHRQQIQLSETTSVGVNITEVGIASNASGDSVCTHAMLQDMNGNPISIFKTDTDIINIYATVYVHWNPQGYDNGSIHIGANEQLVRAYNSNKYATGLFGLLLGKGVDITTTRAIFSSGPIPFLSCRSEWSYHPFTIPVSRIMDVENRRITYNVNRLKISELNTGVGIKSCAIGGKVTCGSSAAFGGLFPEILIDSPSEGLPGTIIEGESIGTGDGVNCDFSTAFPFASSAKVYVNGILDSNVTIDSTSPGSSASISSFFENVHSHTKAFATIGRPLGIHTTPPITNNMVTSYGRYNSNDVGAGAYEVVYYNPCYEYGVEYIHANDFFYSTTQAQLYRISVSDDLVTWVDLPVFSRLSIAGATRDGIKVPEEYSQYKYWSIRYASNQGDDYLPQLMLLPVEDVSKNIHFTTPPPEGSVITIDYYTPVVAKDANHVFDLTVTVQLGEYHE